MLIVPEARTAIVRTAAVAIVAIGCIVGAIRAHRRWARIVLAIVAIFISLAVLFGILVIHLITRYGPR